MLPRFNPVALWRGALQRKYSRDMGSTGRGRPVRPVPRLAVLDEYAGLWVAVKDGEVIAHAPTSRGVARELLRLGERAKGAVLQRVATAHEPLSVGLG